MNLLFELYLTLLTNTALDSGKQTNIINENMSLYDFKKILCCMSVSQVLLIKTYSESWTLMNIVLGRQRAVCLCDIACCLWI